MDLVNEQESDKYEVEMRRDLHSLVCLTDANGPTTVSTDDHPSIHQSVHLSVRSFVCLASFSTPSYFAASWLFLYAMPFCFKLTLCFTWFCELIITTWIPCKHCLGILHTFTNLYNWIRLWELTDSLEFSFSLLFLPLFCFCFFSFSCFIFEIFIL